MSGPVVAALITAAGNIVVALINRGHARALFGTIGAVLLLIAIGLANTGSTAQATSSRVEGASYDPPPARPTGSIEGRLPPPAPSPPSMTVSVSNRYGGPVQFRFFYEGRTGRGQAPADKDRLEAFESSPVTVPCNVGEILCVGASTVPARGSWAVGINNEDVAELDRAERQEYCVACDPNDSKTFKFDPPQ
jgi:hypothetical protein